MNELGWNDTESNAFIGSDKTKLAGHIESVFVDAWRKAVNIFPKTYFEAKDFSNATHSWDIHTGLGHVRLPEDFYALYSFKMLGWQKSVETLLEITDMLASVQANEYTRGSVVRPVCVRTMRPANGLIVPVLEYYSLPRGVKHNISEAIYIPIVAPLENEPKLNKKLYIPLAYLCAGLVFNIFEKHDIAQVLEAKAVEITDKP
jgi:hypothetical protein